MCCSFCCLSLMFVFDVPLWCSSLMFIFDVSWCSLASRLTLKLELKIYTGFVFYMMLPIGIYEWYWMLSIGFHPWSNAPYSSITFNWVPHYKLSNKLNAKSSAKALQICHKLNCFTQGSEHPQKNPAKMLHLIFHLILKLQNLEFGIKFENLLPNFHL